jgi:hypothetical protein
VHAFLHLLSVFLLLPSLVFAFACLLLAREIADKSFLKFLWRLLTTVPWEILGVAAVVIAIAIAGFFVQSRWIAALCVAVLCIASTAIAIWMEALTEWGQVWFFVPGLVALAIGVWLVITEWPWGSPA